MPTEALEGAGACSQCLTCCDEQKAEAKDLELDQVVWSGLADQALERQSVPGLVGWEAYEEKAAEGMYSNSFPSEGLQEEERALRIAQGKTCPPRTSSRTPLRVGLRECALVYVVEQKRRTPFDAALRD